MNKERRKDQIIENLKEENSILHNKVSHLQDRINTLLYHIEILKKNNRNVAISITEINATLKVIKQAAVKDFAEKLKEAIHERDYIQGYAEIGLIEEIDELLKEYTK